MRKGPNGELQLEDGDLAPGKFWEIWDFALKSGAAQKPSGSTVTVVKIGGLGCPTAEEIVEHEFRALYGVKPDEKRPTYTPPPLPPGSRTDAYGRRW